MDVACQLSCTYCYQNPIRDAGNTTGKPYNMELMKQALKASGQSFTVFGGEPLLVPIEDLEELWRFGLEQYEERIRNGVQQYQSVNGIQTNGALVTEAHIALFQKYKVHVGFSMDGPGELNDARWAGNLDKTRAATERSQWAMEQCLANGVGASLILTLHRGNVGTPDRMARIKVWLRDLEARGMFSARLHNLEIEYPELKGQLELTDEENIRIFGEFAEFENELRKERPADQPSLRFDVYKDVELTLTGSEDVTCTFSPCDPYTTSAVHGVDGQGRLSNCQRANKDGVNWVKAETVGKERQFALYHTPQQDGGCKDCRFFLMCKGQCPGTAIDGEWRNRSKDCKLWYSLFERIERQLLDRGEIPKSVGPDRKQREQAFLERLWNKSGKEYTNGHGDHWDGPGGPGTTGTGNRPHGDEHGNHWDDTRPNMGPNRPHGDEHGNHTDGSPEFIARRKAQIRGNRPQEGNRPHGDAPHGDAPHGDHNDAAIPTRVR
jgi:uncharacterized protein